MNKLDHIVPEYFNGITKHTKQFLKKYKIVEVTYNT